MPYARREDRLACDARYRQRHREYRRASWRQYVRSHPETNARNTRAHKRARRIRIFARDGWACVYCGLSGDEKKLTIDHKIPRSKDGPDIDANRVTACWSCNRRKYVKTYWQFMEIIRRERGQEPFWFDHDEHEEVAAIMAAVVGSSTSHAVPRGPAARSRRASS